MNYPFWEVPLLGGGLVIAIIAVLHVFVSHFAVGGGLFLSALEARAYRENDSSLLAYVKIHTKFFLLLTIVFGAVSGVGIWFTIGLVHPDATSLLIHTFVWIWAIEWTFFLVEVSAILIYYATWETLSPKVHNQIGWIYFISAYLSMIAINGILTFMLTPGGWIANKSIISAFFNPTMLPSLVIRTGVALALAGLYATFTASALFFEEVKRKVIRYSCGWTMLGAILIFLGAILYNLVLQFTFGEILVTRAPALTIFAAITVILSTIIFAFAYFIGCRHPDSFTRPLALMFLLLGLLVTGATEWTREAVRKPFVIYGYMFSNSILKEELPQISQAPILSQAKWVSYREVFPWNYKDAGKEIFRVECQSCHTINGYNGIKALVDGWTEEDIYDAIGRLDRLKPFMPPFVGTEEERRALSKYLHSLNE